MKTRLFFSAIALAVAGWCNAADYLTLTLYADDCESANVIKCNTGQQINVTPVPDGEHRHFVRWADGNTGNPRLVTVTKDEVLKAEFADDPILTVVSADEKMGTVSGAGQFKPNSYEISATANYGYYFTKWSDGDTNNPRTVVLTKDTTFTAEFAYDRYTITTKVNDAECGSVSGGTTAEYLSNITLTATANLGYHFCQWSDGDTNNPRTVVLTKDTTFTAEFAQSYSGKCGDNLSWNYAGHTLTISGEGDMYDYTYDYGDDYKTNMPWLLFRDTIDEVVLEQGITHIGANAFRACTKPTSITIPNTVTNIGSSAFYGCSKLTSITIPNSVTSIGEKAFNGCTGLKTLVIPNSVTDMPANLLSGLEALDSISVPAAVFQGATYNEQPSAMSYVELTGDEMTDDVLSVLQRNNETLRTLDISQTSNTTIPKKAFYNYYLRTLRLPANLTAIPYMAATECLWLQSITIPASVVEIESRAFENCRSLKSVVFDGATTDGATTDGASTCSLRRIGDWAFYNCHELQSLTIPEGVTEIGNAAFYGCTYLTEITLPSSVTSIDDNAFALCGKIQKIRVAATTPPTLRAKTFYEVNRSIPVYVPAEAVGDYKSDIYWREFNIQSNAPTAIDNTTVDTTPHKVFRNGQVLIQRGDKTYTVTGVEVK